MKNLFNFVAAEFPKTPSPKPASIHSPDPFLRAGKFSRGFAKSFSPENSFGKTESTESALRIPSVSPLGETQPRPPPPYRKKETESAQHKKEWMVARRGRNRTAEAEADCRTRQSGGAEAVP